MTRVNQPSFSDPSTTVAPSAPPCLPRLPQPCFREQRSWLATDTHTHTDIQTDRPTRQAGAHAAATAACQLPCQRRRRRREHLGGRPRSAPFSQHSRVASAADVAQRRPVAADPARLLTPRPDVSSVGRASRAVGGGERESERRAAAGGRVERPHG